MEHPKITILTNTTRSIMPEQVEALKHQTFKDFEWVIVDDHYEDQKQNIVRLVGDSFPVTHTLPREILPYSAVAMCQNTGLLYAKGELIYFMVDYILPCEFCLERHWEIHERYSKAMISGRGIQVAFSPNEKVTELPGADYRSYLFDTFFIKTQIEDDLYEAYRDGIQNWWAGRNDSAPLEAILDCNGFEEKFDGRWGGSDADLAQRLMTYGLRYLLDMKSFCLELKHETGAKKPSIRSEREQQALQETVINRKVREGIFTSDLPFSLREQRNVI